MINLDYFMILPSDALFITSHHLEDDRMLIEREVFPHMPSMPSIPVPQPKDMTGSKLMSPSTMACQRIC